MSLKDYERIGTPDPGDNTRLVHFDEMHSKYRQDENYRKALNLANEICLRHTGKPTQFHYLLHKQATEDALASSFKKVDEFAERMEKIKLQSIKEQKK